MSNKKTKSSNKSFGIVFFIFFLILSALAYKNNIILTYFLIFVAFLFLFLAMKKSELLSPLNKIWIKFGIVLGKIISPIVMGLVYFSVVYLTKIFLILIKKDILNLKLDKNIHTYWINKNNNEKSNMENQF